MSFPRYPEYKDSGVEWLGEVPVHWLVTALKRGFSVTLGKMLQPDSSGPEDELLPYLRAANIQWDGVNSNDIKLMWFSKRDCTQLRLEYGDLLVSEGGDVGRSCLWAAELEHCYFQNSVNRVRARDGNSNRYLYYWMSTVKDKGYIDVLCNKSTIAHFTAEKVAAVPVPLPSPNEQAQIAAFLDRETAKIDALVAEQRRLMELLKEKRQAFISHAVTRGLNPDAQMKSSGIEWLGDVPAHWEVERIKHLASRISSGKTPSGGSEVYVDKGITFLRSQNVYDEGLRLDDVAFITEAVDVEMAGSRVVAHDILLNITGASIGRSCVVPTSLPAANVNQHVCVIRLIDISFVPFIGWAFKSSSIKNQIDYSQNGAAREGLNFVQIGEMVIAIPPVIEQVAISTFLETESAKFDTLTAEAQRGIDLLAERRTALISAAVTGQIDVRNVVAT